MIKGKHTFRTLISDYHYCNMGIMQKESFYILSCYIGQMTKKYYHLTNDKIYPYLLRQDYSKLCKNIKVIRKDLKKTILGKLNIFSYQKNLELF